MHGCTRGLACRPEEQQQLTTKRIVVAYSQGVCAQANPNMPIVCGGLLPQGRQYGIATTIELSENLDLLIKAFKSLSCMSVDNGKDAT